MKLEHETKSALGVEVREIKLNLQECMRRLGVQWSHEEPKGHMSVKECLAGLGLEEYHDLFLNEGFETIDDLKAMTERDLEEIGVSKKGQRARIMRSLLSIQSSPAPEGDGMERCS